MQITCPRCSAKYEVPDEVMPSGGRDVQCSDCGHSWYQLVARPVTEAPAPLTLGTPAAVAAADPEPETADAPPTDRQPSGNARARLREMRDAMEQESAEPDMSALPPPDPATEADEGDAAPMPETRAPGFEPMDMPNIGLDAPQRRELDPAVAAVLRAEAEFERQARIHGPAQALEMQPELGLELPSRLNRRSQDTVRDRLARLQAAARDENPPRLETPAPKAAPKASPAETPAETPGPKPAGARRDPAPERVQERPPERPRPQKAGLPARAPRRDIAAIEREQAIARRSFRWGFALSLSACLAAAALYLASPALAEWLPGQSDMFAGIARKGAQVHLNLAAGMQDWLARLGNWMQQLAANGPA